MSAFKHLVLGLLFVAAGGACAGEPTPEHSASCVAALKLRVDALTQRLQAGDTQVQGELTAVIEHGFAFIGDAYLQGQHDKQAAQDLLAKAERKQAALSEAQIAQRQAACRVEASRLLAETPGINRVIVASAARARVAKIKKAAGG